VFRAGLAVGFFRGGNRQIFRRHGVLQECVNPACKTSL
jgi:hypothetical protein